MKKSAELLALCYAAMEPSKSLWEKYLREIDKLLAEGTVSPEEHVILRVEPLATKELMDLTLGDEEAFTGGSIRQIIDRVKADLVKEQTIEIEHERKAHLRTILERNNLIEQNTTIKSGFYWLADKVAGLFIYFLIATVLLILALGAIGSSLLTTSYIKGSLIFHAIVLCAILAAVSWGLVNWYFGVPLQALLRNLQNRIQDKLFNLIYKALSKN